MLRTAPGKPRLRVLIVSHEMPRVDKLCDVAVRELPGVEAVPIVAEVTPGDLPVGSVSWDVVVLDIPEYEDPVAATYLAARGFGNAIILLLVAQLESETVCECLAAGASYLLWRERPVGIFQAYLRRAADLASAVAEQAGRFGSCNFDRDTGRVESADGSVIARLSRLEALVFRVLLRHRGDWISRKDLEAEIWGMAKGVRSRACVQVIYRLRGKLMFTPGRLSIRYRNGAGYRLVGPEREC